MTNLLMGMCGNLYNFYKTSVSTIPTGSRVETLPLEVLQLERVDDIVSFTINDIVWDGCKTYVCKPWCLYKRM